MLLIAGILLIIGSLYVGVDPYVDFNWIETSQVTLIAGVVAVCIYFRDYVHALQNVIPILLGVAVFVGMGVMERDLMGLAGGTAIVAVTCFNLWKAPKSIMKKSGTKA